MSASVRGPWDNIIQNLVCSTDKISSGEGTVSWLPTWYREEPGPQAVSCPETLNLYVEIGDHRHTRIEKWSCSP